IDLVLLSHNHYDHLDDRTVRRLAAREPRATWLVPLGLGRFVRARGARDVWEHDWWQETPIGPALVACTPAQHFRSRGLRDRGAMDEPPIRARVAWREAGLAPEQFWMLAHGETRAL